MFILFKDAVSVSITTLPSEFDVQLVVSLGSCDDSPYVQIKITVSVFSF